MRAVVIREHGGPEVLRVEEVADPTPGPGQVRVRVRAAALNHLDIWVRRGLPGAPFQLPVITGADAAGVIDAVGPGVVGVAAGDAVVVAPGVSCGVCAMCVSGRDALCPKYGILGESRDGALAELVVVPEANVVAKPEAVGFEGAAAMALSGLTAWHMLVERAAVRPGETVLVQAAGSGVGVMAIQIARFLGARVLAAAGSEEKRNAALELGAEQVFDSRGATWVKEVKAATGGRGVDVVVEHVGGAVFEGSLRVLAWGGRVVTCGATIGVEVQVNLRHLFFKSQSILGSTMGNKGDFHKLVALMGQGVLKPVIGRTVSLDEVGAAQAAMERREILGKVVVVP